MSMRSNINNHKQKDNQTTMKQRNNLPELIECTVLHNSLITSQERLQIELNITSRNEEKQMDDYERRSRIESQSTTRRKEREEKRKRSTSNPVTRHIPIDTKQRK